METNQQPIRKKFNKKEINDLKKKRDMILKEKKIVKK